MNAVCDDAKHNHHSGEKPHRRSRGGLPPIGALKPAFVRWMTGNASESVAVPKRVDGFVSKHPCANDRRKDDGGCK
jgi:hypothetical protein